MHLCSTGAVAGFGILVGMFPFLRDEWSDCSRSCFMGLPITGHIALPRMRDVLILAFKMSRSPKTRVSNIGEIMLASLCTVIAHGFRNNIEFLSSECVPMPVRTNHSRKSSTIDAELAWDVLRQADEKNVSPVMLLRCRKSEYENISICHGRNWEWLRCLMTMNKASSMFNGVQQISISFDPSTYNGEETCVGLAYTNLHGGVASFLPIAVIPNGKKVPRSGVALLSEIQTAIARGKETRWAAYKD